MWLMYLNQLWDIMCMWHCTILYYTALPYHVGACDHVEVAQLHNIYCSVNTRSDALTNTPSYTYTVIVIIVIIIINLLLLLITAALLLLLLFCYFYCTVAAGTSHTTTTFSSV